MQDESRWFEMVQTDAKAKGKILIPNVPTAIVRVFPHFMGYLEIPGTHLVRLAME